MKVNLTSNVPQRPPVGGPASQRACAEDPVPVDEATLSGSTRPPETSPTREIALPSEAGAISRSLYDFLRTPPQDPRVQELVASARARYSEVSHPLARARAQAREAYQMGGGRQDSWIQDTFGRNEQSITAELSQQPPPSTWSLDEIHTAFAALTREHPPDASLGPPKIISVKGVGVNYLGDTSSKVEGGFCQLASQYNYLESPGAYTVPVSDYLYDRTQGPQGAIEAAAGALHRHAAVTAGSLPHALSEVLPHPNPSYYKDGYLEIFRLQPAELNTLYEELKQKLPQFRILAQPVTGEASNTSYFQVMSAAPSWQGQSPPRPDSLEAKLASALVVPQYEAIAKMAVMKSLITGNWTPVHLTLVGQGVFNNPPEVMTEAIRRVASIVRGYEKVQVFVQSYSSHEPVRRAQQEGLFRLEEQDRTSFEA